nr:T9SS type A sorting domain-containing protein [Bacteroidota bacterium]
MSFQKKHLAAIVLLLFVGSIFLLMNHQGQSITNSPIKNGPAINKKLAKGHFALYNAEQEFQKTRNPITGEIPENIKAQQLSFIEKQMVGVKSREDQDWTHRGPFNAGGRMLCVAVDITDESVMLAGSASGGMWRSVNSGQSWGKVTPAIGEQSATCLIQDSREGKTNTWYYGTGEILNTTNRNVSTNVRTIGVGDGIFKSTDNGATWQPLASTQGGNPGELKDVFQGVWRIVTDPVETEKDIVYAACYGAIMRSENGGETWAITLGDLTNKSFATDVAITSEGILYAVLSSYSTSIMRPEKAGVWRSYDGINWKEITPETLPDVTRVMKLAIAPSNESVMYMMTEKPSEVHVPYSGIFNSDNTFWKYTFNAADTSHVWEDRTETMYGHGKGDFLSYPYALISYGGYTFELGVKPDDENVVFIGGMSLFRSNNGFADSLETTWMGGDPFDMDSIHWLHPDQHDFAFLPSDPDVFFAACDGGIIYTEDCMADDIFWNRLNNHLATTQFYSVTIDHASTTDDFILGGLQDNNWYYTPTDDPGEFWFSVDLYYDGFSCKVADNHDYAIVAAYSGNIWTTKFDEQMHTTDIIYQTPDTLLSFYNPIIGSNPIFPFYCNFALDPNNNETFYLPTINSIWRKDNMKAAASDTNLRNVGWSQLSNISLSESVEVTVLSLSTTPANKLFFGTNNGHIYRVDNAHAGNPPAVEITGDNFPFNAYIACIDVDENNADKIFTVFSNYGVKSIYYSDDAGESWSHVSGNLEEYPDGSGYGPSVRWVKSLTYDQNTVYFAGTSVGLYTTTLLDGDATIWAQESPESIGTIMVDMIDARSLDGFTAVATQGNGIYSMYYDGSASVGEDKNGPGARITNFPNPFYAQTTIDYFIASAGMVCLGLYDIQGKKIQNLFEGFQQEGDHKYNLLANKLSSGIYFVKINVDNTQEVHKIIKAQH